jgi:hypothetical protein
LRRSTGEREFNLYDAWEAARAFPGDMAKRRRKQREKWFVLVNPQATVTIALERSVSRSSRIASSSLTLR